MDIRVNAISGAYSVFFSIIFSILPLVCAGKIIVLTPKALKIPLFMALIRLGVSKAL
jgi:hypothetical protein